MIAANEIEALITAGVYDANYAAGTLQSHDEASASFYGTNEADTLAGGIGQDMLDGGEGDDSLSGGAGDDVLYGYLGDDTLIGGAGNDQLEGGEGADVYRFELGDGTDQLSDAGEIGSPGNRIVFGVGIDESDLSASWSGSDLVLHYGALGDSIIVQNYDAQLPTTERPIDLIELSSGVQLSLADLAAQAGPGGGEGSGGEGPQTTSPGVEVNWDGWSRTSVGTSGDDVIVGGAGADFIFGGDGNDMLRAAEDPTSSSRYDDFLDGGSGNDTYLVEQGDPVATISQASAASGDIDVVRFGAGITAASLQFSHVNRSYVEISDQYGQLMAQLQDWWTPSVQRISRLEFDDGTFIQAGDVDSLVTKGLYIASDGTPDPSGHGESQATFYGDSSNNVMTGGAGNDVFDGATGNDTLNGGEGSDTYYVGPGLGQDVVVEADAEGNDADMLQFYGVGSDQLWFRQAGNDLEVSVIGTSDSLTVTDWYVGTGHRIETLKAGDGKTLLDSQVQNLVQAMAGFSPPASGETTLPANYQSSLNTVIAANWQ